MILTVDEIYEYYKSTGTPIEIEIVSSLELFEDSYAENGMVGKIIDMYEDSNDDYYHVIIDWNGYDDINIPLEANDWYISSSKPTKKGTMKEAGLFPKDGKEEYLVDFGKKPFNILNDSDIKYQNQYIQFKKDNLNTDMTFTRWLIRRIIELEKK